jgi:hypothetical protein
MGFRRPSVRIAPPRPTSPLELARSGRSVGFCRHLVAHSLPLSPGLPSEVLAEDLDDEVPDGEGRYVCFGIFDLAPKPEGRGMAGSGVGVLTCEPDL